LLLFASMLGAPFWRRAFDAAARRGGPAGPAVPSRSAGPVRLAALVLLAVLIPVAVFQPLLMRDVRFAYHHAKNADPWIALGRAMHADRARFGTVVCAAAGKIPFFAEGDFVDPIGLNDAELARLPLRKFQPGHSSGSVAAAQAMLRREGRAFTVFTFLPYPDGGENTSLRNVDRRSVLLCVSVEQPDSVHTVMTDAFWRRVERGGAWCAVVLPAAER
jgi:hypothetical protein